ncbi:hypothetical protein ID866_8212 [Astraeus odoratus]|nr:hypothetical protein ID866_8212 [Astraeus odoratus]
MGTGIALVSALKAKVPVLLHDKSKDQVSKGLALVDKLLAKDVTKGRLQSAEAQEARERVRVADTLEDMRDVDMVVEAVSENLDLKRAVFRSFAETLKPDAILATNTSSISITKIAAAAIPDGVSAASEEGKAAAGRVVGLHFFNPVPVMYSCYVSSTDYQVSIGLDTCLAIQKTLYTGTADSKYRPSVLLERMVDAQWLGRKSGRGFYEYKDD